MGTFNGSPNVQPAMNTRSKIIATIGVLWLAAIAVIAVQTWNTDSTKLDLTNWASEEEQYDVWFWEGERLCDAKWGEEFYGEDGGVRPVVSTDRLLCRPWTIQNEFVVEPAPTMPDYDVAGAAIQAAGVSLVAAVLIGATVIWTRPKDEEPVDAVTTPTAGARPPPSAPTPPADPVPTTQPAPVVEDGGATVEASLRRLKALHDDGILTDAEYETKRKALTDKL